MNNKEVLVVLDESFASLEQQLLSLEKEQTKFNRFLAATRARLEVLEEYLS